MNESEETLKAEPTLTDIMNELVKINRRLDGYDDRLKKFDNQFESIREGIVYNASRFDRLEGNVFSVRGDISNLRADLRDLAEEVRHSRKVLA